MPHLSFLFLADLNQTVMGRVYTHFLGSGSSTGKRIMLTVGLALATHIVVKIVRHVSEWLIARNQARKDPLAFVTRKPKFVTLARLIVSGVTFTIYFFALGFVLEEIGVNLTAYLASASIIGLAVSFGSQGFIQDIVISLTLIFCDAMEVGDMVEIAGAAIVNGRVEEIGLRFTKVINFYNQEVFIPNRTIANVSRFNEGGIQAYVDIHVPNVSEAEKAVQIASAVAKGLWLQFGAIVLSEPHVGSVVTPDGGSGSYFRVQFKIWPGQGSLIETTFRQQLAKAMQALDPNYTDSQVVVTYRAITAVKKI